ncbi:YybH family protein [Spirosoma endbachense]|uniref:SnoaL-like domain-containing protein n=1 Tax=Spirosoma endbachense TaxID=2666025 RepID=A0A6P1W7W8_9BACT|nr:nuclear transport factor 2 family protein [Spirosoma endbachense]QHW00148.1 hypothetical protein GJR95_36290 [Spirosoma endbachense]
MKTEQTPITGKEKKGSLSPDLQALSDFYAAFNERDIMKMEQNWEQSDEAVMDNPVGGIMRGWANIKAVYERIFGGMSRVEVEFYDYTAFRTSEIFFVVGRERGTLKKEDLTLELQIRTTRVFHFIKNNWKQIHHHGSMDDTELLEKYQQVLKGGR